MPASEKFYVLEMDEAAEVFEEVHGRPPADEELQQMKKVFGNALSDGAAADYLRIAAQEVA